MNPDAFCVVCITDLGGGSGLGSAPVKDVKDAITAHTLAGHVDEALSAFMVLINKHRDAVQPKDVYQGVYPLFLCCMRVRVTSLCNQGRQMCVQDPGALFQGLL